MAVQKSRKSRAKRGTRRTHDNLAKPTLSENETTGEVHRRHHIDSDGYYRGRQIIETNIYSENPEE